MQLLKSNTYLNATNCIAIASTLMNFVLGKWYIGILVIFVVLLDIYNKTHPQTQKSNIFRLPGVAPFTMGILAITTAILFTLEGQKNINAIAWLFSGIGNFSLAYVAYLDYQPKAKGFLTNKLPLFENILRTPALFFNLCIFAFATFLFERTIKDAITLSALIACCTLSISSLIYIFYIQTRKRQLNQKYMSLFCTGCNISRGVIIFISGNIPLLIAEFFFIASNYYLYQEVNTSYKKKR